MEPKPFLNIDLPDIRSNYQGFERLISLAERLNGVEYETILIDMEHTRWFDANMCAPFGALLYQASRQLNTVEIVNIPPPIEMVLSKNGFLSNYGRHKSRDVHGTTVQYQRFGVQDERYFAEYVEQSLVGKGLPSMSEGAIKKIRESIFEIFSNAVLHSDTKNGIFSCGQYFPQKSCFQFSIADLGIGIKNVIRQKRGLELTAAQAIQWATEDSNTTKTGSIPGGLGLKLLKEFISKNNGCILITSDTGFWRYKGGQIYMSSFRNCFPGTVVNIEVNTADTSFYCLTSEVSNEDIF